MWAAAPIRSHHAPVGAQARRSKGEAAVPTLAPLLQKQTNGRNIYITGSEGLKLCSGTHKHEGIDVETYLIKSQSGISN